MAARVGSVVVDLIANTAQFESGMQQAAATTQATDRMITQKSWQAAQSTDRMSGAMERFERRSMGAQASMESTTAAMVAGQFGGAGLARIVFTLDTAYARLSLRAKDAAASLAASGVAMKGVNSQAAILVKTLAVMAGKVAILTAGIWGWKKVWDAIMLRRLRLRRLDESTEEGQKQHLHLLQTEYDWMVKQEGALERVLQLYRTGKTTFDEARQAIQVLAAGANWDRMADRIKAVADQIDQMKIREGIDPETGRVLTENARKLLAINQAFQGLGEDVAKIEDEQLRRQAELILAFERRGAVRREKERQAIAALNEQRDAHIKAHTERMTQIREQAQALADMFTRAAGLATGFGRDMWRAIQESTRAQRADQVQRHMLEQSGALDQEDKRNLRELREYMRDLLGQAQRLEAASI